MVDGRAEFIASVIVLYALLALPVACFLFETISGMVKEWGALKCNSFVMFVSSVLLWYQEVLYGLAKIATFLRRI